MDVSDLTYISIAAHQQELILIRDMEDFTHYFCYLKKQKQGKVVLPAPRPGNDDEDDTIGLLSPAESLDG